jgi:hypothetical protein
MTRPRSSATTGASFSRVVTSIQPSPPPYRIERVPTRAIVGRLLTSLAGHGAPLLVVLDDAHLLTDRSSLDALAEFITYRLGSRSPSLT